MLAGAKNLMQDCQDRRGREELYEEESNVETTVPPEPAGEIQRVAVTMSLLHRASARPTTRFHSKQLFSLPGYPILLKFVLMLPPPGLSECEWAYCEDDSARTFICKQKFYCFSSLGYSTLS